MRARLIAVADVPEGGAVGAELTSAAGDLSLLLTKVAGEVRAFHNECPHAGRRLDWAPGRFLVENGLLICSAHGARFRLADGRCVGGPCRGAGLRPVAIGIADGTVVVG